MLRKGRNDKRFSVAAMASSQHKAAPTKIGIRPQNEKTRLPVKADGFRVQRQDQYDRPKCSSSIAIRLLAPDSMVATWVRVRGRMRWK